MKPRRSSGLMLIVVFALLGGLLVYIPPQLVAQYERVSSWGRGAVIAYFVIVGTCGLILAGCTSWIVIRLWRATRRKSEREARRSKNPSELSDREREKEMADNLAAIDDLQ